MIDIKKLRKELKMSQKEFALKLGYSHPYISIIENGKEPLSDNFLDKLQEVFKIDTNAMKSYNKVQVNRSFNQTTINEPQTASNEESLREKYLTLLEKYNNCLEEKSVLIDAIKAFQEKTDLPKNG